MELSRLLAADGHRLVLVARNEAALNQLAEELRKSRGVTVDVLPADLSKPQAPREVFDRVSAMSIDVDILINNAGFGLYGRFDQTDYQQTLDLIQVNCAALAGLTNLFLPGMIERKRGRIMNVASIAAFLPGPLMAAYYASKAFVLSLSEAIDEEVRGKGITVTALCPGPVETDFQKRAKVSNSLVFRGNLMTARRCAEIGYRAMTRGRRVAVTGSKNWMLHKLIRSMPRVWTARVAKKLNQNR